MTDQGPIYKDHTIIKSYKVLVAALLLDIKFSTARYARTTYQTSSYLYVLSDLFVLCFNLCLFLNFCRRTSMLFV